MTEPTADILEVLKEYKRRLRAFKRDMEKLGIRVKVTASFGPWTSVVEEVDDHAVSEA